MLLFELLSNIVSKSLDILGLYSKMAVAYLSLGCSGKSGAMLSIAKQIAESIKCDAFMKTMFQSRYGLYLAVIGNSEKSKSIFESLEIFPKDQLVQPLDRTTSIYRAQVCLDKSRASFIQGSVPLAVAEANMAYGVLAKLFKQATHTLNSKSSSSNKLSHQNALETETLLTRLFVECCWWLGMVYSMQGSFLESEAFFRKGLESSQIAHSDGWITEFSISLAELKARMDETGASIEMRNVAESHSSKVQTQLSATTSANLMIMEADIFRREGSFTKSLSKLEEANTELEKATEKSFLSKLEDVPMIYNAASPKGTKAVAVPSQFTPLAKIKIKGKTSNDVLFQCFGLNNMRADVLVRRAATLNDQQKFNDEHKILSQIERIDHDMFKEAGYYAAMAVSNFEQFLSSQKNNQKLQVFADSIFSIPWCVSPTTTVRKKVTAALQFEKYINQIDTLLEQSLDLVRKYGSVETRRDIAMSWNLFQHLKAALLPSTVTNGFYFNLIFNLGKSLFSSISLYAFLNDGL